MPRQKLPKQFEPTSLEDILAGRVADDTSLEANDIFTSEALQPRALNVRRDEGNSSPEFKLRGTRDAEATFRILDGTADDDPYWLYFSEVLGQIENARRRIKRREQEGLPPNPWDRWRLKEGKRGLNELLPNLFRQERQ